MQMALLPHALDRKDVDLRVRDAGGQDRVRELELSALPEGLDERSVLSGIGLTARQALLPPVVGKVRPDTRPGACWPRTTASPPSTASRSGISTTSAR